MTPRDRLNNGALSIQHAPGIGTARAASTICLLAAIWLFVSPWVYGAFGDGNAWNSWIVGGFIILFSLVRISRPAYGRIFSWINLVLGVWVFFSPWIYGYVANTGRFINSLCVGVVVFLFSIVSARMATASDVPPATGSTAAGL